MYKIAKITFKPLIKDKEKIISSIDRVLGMLYSNGQILDYLLENYDTYFLATVTTTDDDSLNEVYFNEYIKKELLNFSIEINVVCDDPLATNSCHCSNPSYYIIEIDRNASSPIKCGDCTKEIPLIRIPYLYKEEEHYSILNYQKTWQHVDDLWIYGLSDRFTKRQITNIDSQLNKSGLKIREELEKKVNKPVYFFIDHEIGVFNGKYKLLTNCPKCGNSLRIITKRQINKMCDHCRLAFSNIVN